MRVSEMNFLIRLALSLSLQQSDRSLARPRRTDFVRIHITLDKRDHSILQNLFAEIGISGAIQIAVKKLLVEHETIARQLEQGKADV